MANLCDSLLESKVPSTVCHGDLRIWNMTMYNGHSCLFDWHECTISHPFLDILSLQLSDDDHYLSYIKFWKGYDDFDRLCTSLSLAKLLEPLWVAYRISRIRKRSKSKLGREAEKQFLQALLWRLAEAAYSAGASEALSGAFEN